MLPPHNAQHSVVPISPARMNLVHGLSEHWRNDAMPTHRNRPGLVHDEEVLVAMHDLHRHVRNWRLMAVNFVCNTVVITEHVVKRDDCVVDCVVAMMGL